MRHYLDWRGRVLRARRSEEVEGMFDVVNQVRRRDIATYARQRGVACCAHISDLAVTRLQAARLARQASERDDVTLERVSLEEAGQVLRERRLELMTAAAR